MQDTKQQVVVAITAISIILIFLGILFIIMLLYYRNKKKQTARDKENMRNSFQQQILQSQLETQEETLATLGKELHDNIGQLLNSAKLLIGVTQRNFKDAPATLNIADETIGTAINELRSLSKSLNKEWLQQFDFIENLGTEIKRINATNSLRINFLPIVHLPLKIEEQIILFRIVQEALQNAIKHSHARTINISITENADSLLIVVEDDGNGMETNENSRKGIGIINMKQRVKLLNGSIQWHSSGGGTAVNLQLPVKPFSK